MRLNKLISLGLSDNEARVYLSALELGETSVYRLAQKSGVKRTTTYLAVESLKAKGLISAHKRKKSLICFAENPQKIGDFLDEKKNTFEKILPELLAYNNSIEKKPNIRYFEGKEAYKNIFNDCLKYPDQEILATFNEKFWNYGEYFIDYFIPQRKAKKIWARVLFRDNPDLRKIAKDEKEHFFQSKLVTSDKFKIEIEILIYGNNKVGLVSYDEELAIIIESQKIHDTQRSLFEVIWDLIK